ncbi:Extracellular membrane protein, CFEM domain protein [Ascosphaera apis ARSEF 7405]|uniref:Extracellular membrane protein, CFEM domain protein n=1 Tax=Ascosphaera apis ARSEF 7405 TaxID=392613 RepID=A0A167ZSG9_9EURO|nr:Extracellular membrane protein, CFEM domain protein [Ascosphaera apis ARSEF 7405]
MKFTAAAFLGLAALASAQSLADIPKCALSCVAGGLPENCHLEAKCICSDKDFLAKMSCCLVDACPDPADQKKIMGVAHAVCNSVGVDVPSSIQCPSKDNKATTSAAPETTEAAETTTAAPETTAEAKPTTTVEAKPTTEAAETSVEATSAAASTEAVKTTVETTSAAVSTSAAASTSVAASSSVAVSSSVAAVSSAASAVVPTTLATSAPAAVASTGAPHHGGNPTGTATPAPFPTFESSNGASLKAASAGALAIAAGALLL